MILLEELDEEPDLLGRVFAHGYEEPVISVSNTLVEIACGVVRLLGV